MIINGELKTGLGGGTCQVSTTVFNAAYEAGLPITARTNHALYISHYPQGRDATVNYPDTDLKFVNDTDHWLLLRTFVSASSLTVNLYGTPQHRRVESEVSPLRTTGPVPTVITKDPKLLKGKKVVDEAGSPPLSTSVTRRVYDADGKLLYENTWYSSYVGEKEKVRVGTKPKPKPAAPSRRSIRSTYRPTDARADRRRPPPQRPERLDLLRRGDRLGEPGGEARRAERLAVDDRVLRPAVRDDLGNVFVAGPLEHVLVAEAGAADVHAARVDPRSRSSKKTGFR